MAKEDTSAKTSKKKSTADKAKQPRIRKAETFRERNAKETAKAEAKAAKTPKRRAHRAASKVAKPLKKPASFLAKPFKLRPVRATGRFLGRIFWPKYFRESWKELKLVTWPTRKETIKLTFAVLAFAAIFGLAAAGTDLILDKIIRRIVFRS